MHSIDYVIFATFYSFFFLFFFSEFKRFTSIPWLTSFMNSYYKISFFQLSLRK